MARIKKKKKRSNYQAIISQESSNSELFFGNATGQTVMEVDDAGTLALLTFFRFRVEVAGCQSNQ
jgi:hypothetical protein